MGSEVEGLPLMGFLIADQGRSWQLVPGKGDPFKIYLSTTIRLSNLPGSKPCSVLRWEPGIPEVLYIMYFRFQN